LKGDSPFRLRRAEIVKVIEESENTRRFFLKVEDFPPFKPGQFNMLYVFAQGEVPISISSLRKDLLEHTVRLVGEVTEDLFRLGEGDFIGLRGPYGTYFPLEESKGKNLILVAGGLGLANIKPVVEYVMENREDYGKVYLLVGARTPAGLLYREEYEVWRDRGVELLLTVDKPDEGWKGRVGVVTELFDGVEVNPRESVGMTCGPEIMMWFVVRKLLQMGLDEESIYLSMERHMKCAVGTCGHCQFGYTFLCKDGPIFSYAKIKPLFGVKEL
jgi:NAD(P)H-flavin reductase